MNTFLENLNTEPLAEDPSINHIIEEFEEQFGTTNEQDIHENNIAVQKTTTNKVLPWKNMKGGLISYKNKGVEYFITKDAKDKIVSQSGRTEWGQLDLFRTVGIVKSTIKADDSKRNYKPITTKGSTTYLTNNYAVKAAIGPDTVVITDVIFDKAKLQTMKSMYNKR